MTPERWQRLKEMFSHAAALEGAAQEEYLDAACAEDPKLRAEVAALLAADAAPHAILDSSADQFLPFLESEVVDRWEGMLVGAYRLEECIGRGGMGAVYRARRADAQYEKEVAVKLVRSEFGSDLVLQRLRTERQILANLDHPNIARLLDGGVTEGGAPFLVIELVKGEPIDTYCDRLSLGVTERLRLFREVCAAVSYAHRHLVVHRDLKPANIFVTEEGAIKLLDFGIAKLLQDFPENATRPDATRTLIRALTPEFSSPEQILGLPVTTASDVYSLGVVLFRLLAGRSPYRGRLDSTQEAIREICETEPLKPSAAAVPSIDGKPRGRIDRELDAIVLRALRKEPEKRYSSVEQLSEDVRRYLEGLPVIARGDRLSYRAGKFWRRHRLGVSAGSLAAITLLAGVIVVVREARIAQEQSALAAQHFASVRQLAGTFIFQAHDAIKDLPGAAPARDLLVSTAVKYLDTLAKQSAGDPRLQRELADSYDRLGDAEAEPSGQNTGNPRAALKDYAKAIALFEVLARSSPSDGSLLAKMAALHRKHSRLVLVANGDPAGAVHESQHAIELASKFAALRPDDPTAAVELSTDYAVNGYEQQYAGQSAAATAAFDKSIALIEALHRRYPHDRQIEERMYSTYHNSLTQVPLAQPSAAQLEKSVAKERAVLAFDRAEFDAQREHTPADWRSIATDWNTLGIWQSLKGDTDEALEAFRTAVAAMEHARSDVNNSETELDAVRLRMNLARGEAARERLAEAHELLLGNKVILDTILKRTDTYEVRYFLAECEEELGSIEMKRALAARNSSERLHAWQAAHEWFAKSVPHFEPITKVATLNVWDRPPVDRASAGLARSAMEIERLSSETVRGERKANE